MWPIEGYLIESVENVIFDVKGLVHPPEKIVAFPRFIPDLEGPRRRGKIRYQKVYSISDRFSFLEKNLPGYVVYDPIFDEKLCEVPLQKVKKVYSPVQFLKTLRKRRNLDGLEFAALQCLKILREKSNVPWNGLGVSGSLLVKMQSETSDIDIIVYGSENCWKVYYALQKLLKEGNTPFKAYNLDELKVLYNFRSKDTHMKFEDFVKVESRKVLQGKFMERDYFIRFVKKWNEVNENYGDIRYRNSGYAKIEAQVVDDSESIFTPCKYKIEDAKIVEGPMLEPLSEIVSFRGRFCEQAKKGETVIAQGKIEHVKDFRKNLEYFRLLVGNTPSDFVILKT